MNEAGPVADVGWHFGAGMVSVVASLVLLAPARWRRRTDGRTGRAAGGCGAVRTGGPGGGGAAGGRLPRRRAIGPALVRRPPGRPLRVFIALCGLGSR